MTDTIRDLARAKATFQARTLQREEDCFGLPDFMQAALAAYRKARGGEA